MDITIGGQPSLPDISAPQFTFVTKALGTGKADDGRMRFKAVASSTIQDRAGDEITLPALEKMAAKFRDGLTIFMDHDWKHVESAFGLTDNARVVQAGVDARSKSPIWDLEIEGFVNEPNPRAVQLWQSLDGGYVKLGTSISAFILNHERNKAGGMTIDDVDVFEASIVGVPMNQRSWVQRAVKAVKSFYGEAETEATVEVELGDVVELNGTTGETRVIARAGTPEAEAFHAKYGDPENPVDLEPVEKAAEEPAAEKTCECEGDCTCETPDASKSLDAEIVTSAANTTTTTTNSNYFSIVTPDVTLTSPDVKEAGQESEDALTPETPAAAEDEQPDPVVEKVVTVNADDMAQLVRSVSELSTSLDTARTERAAAIQRAETAESERDAVKAELVLAEEAIRKLMKLPLARKSVETLTVDLANRFPQYDPAVLSKINGVQQK